MPRLAGIVVAASLLSGCFTMTTTVGDGPKSMPPMETYVHRWYAIYGLFPMDDLDSKSLSGGAKDYRVTTEFTFEDIVMSAFTSFATFYRQTVIVEK
jgi:Bor protein